MAHIAMLIANLAGGGAERTVLRIAGGLVGRGHRVDVALFEPAVAYREEAPAAVRLLALSGRAEWARRRRADMPESLVLEPGRAPPVRLARLAAGLVRDFGPGAAALLRRASLDRALRVAHYLERERPDVLFANLAQAEMAALLAARLVATPPPVVPVMRNADPARGRRRERRRLLFPEAAHIVAVSQGVADHVAATLGLAGDRIATVHNPAVTPDLLRRAGREPDHPWFRDGGPPVVLGVGRLQPQKDFPTLIEAFRRVREERPCRLLILGEGPERRALESLARRLGLQDSIALPGWVENPYACMSRAALFALSSRHEGFPGALVEALACGCPAVATDCPAGPSEILDDPALLAPVGDAAGLAQVMLRALARPADPEALRAGARRFSMDRALDGYERVLAQVTGRPPD